MQEENSAVSHQLPSPSRLINFNSVEVKNYRYCSTEEIIDEDGTYEPPTVSLPMAIWTDHILPFIGDLDTWKACAQLDRELYQACGSLDRPWPKSIDLLPIISSSKRTQNNDTPRNRILSIESGRKLILWSGHQENQVHVIDRVRGVQRHIFAADNDDEDNAQNIRHVAVAAPRELCIVAATCEELPTTASTSSLLPLIRLGDREWEEKAVVTSPCGQYACSVAFKRRRPGRTLGGEVSLRLWSISRIQDKQPPKLTMLQSILWPGEVDLYEFGSRDEWNMHACTVDPAMADRNASSWTVVLEHDSPLNSCGRRLFYWKNPFLSSSSPSFGRQEGPSHLPERLPNWKTQILTTSYDGRYLVALCPGIRGLHILRVLDAWRNCVVLLNHILTNVQTHLLEEEEDQNDAVTKSSVRVAMTLDSKYILIAEQVPCWEDSSKGDDDDHMDDETGNCSFVSESSSAELSTTTRQLFSVISLDRSCDKSWIPSSVIGLDGSDGSWSVEGMEIIADSRSTHPSAAGTLVVAYRPTLDDGPLRLQFCPVSHILDGVVTASSGPS